MVLKLIQLSTLFHLILQSNSLVIFESPSHNTKLFFLRFIFNITLSIISQTIKDDKKEHFSKENQSGTEL